MYELGSGTSTGIIGESIKPAEKAWNDSSVGTSWPNLRICKEGSSGCEARNTDGQKVTIKVVAQSGCGRGIACVWRKTSADYEAFATFEKDDGKSAPWQHMKNLEMRIEDPAQGVFDRKREQSSRIRWTLDYTLDNTVYPITGEIWIYLPAVVMHEFGHTLGLADLYNYPGDYPGYLMDSSSVIANTMNAGSDHPSRMPAPAIPRKDIDYVRQVYRNGHGTEPH